MKQVLFLLLFVFIKNVSAQDYLIGFTGSGVVTTVEKIKVENLSQSVSIDLSGNDMLHLVGTVSSNEMKSLINRSSLKIYTVPSNEIAGVEYNTTESGITKFEIFDISGRRICFLNIFLEKGLHLFSVSMINKGIYFLKATEKENILVSKFRSFGNFIGNSQIVHLSSSTDMTNLKSDLSEVVMQYNEGDFLRLTGISGEYSITVTDIPKESRTIDFQFFECKDADGNNYPTVKIGTQIWMKENLKTSRYRNSDIIGTSDPLNLDLTNVEDPKFQWSYNGEESTVIDNGRYYTWFTVVDERNVCPTGWHMPTDSEWSYMEDYLIANGFNFDKSTSENKLNKALSDIESWLYSDIQGTPGNADYSEYRNRSGFSAKAVGLRYITGVFMGDGISARFWSSTKDKYEDDSSWGRNIDYEKTYVYRYNFFKKDGLSVRCIKD